MVSPLECLDKTQFRSVRRRISSERNSTRIYEGQVSCEYNKHTRTVNNYVYPKYSPFIESVGTLLQLPGIIDWYDYVPEEWVIVYLYFVGVYIENVVIVDCYIENLIMLDFTVYT